MGTEGIGEMQPLVIFDIDGTLTDFRGFIKRCAIPYFEKKYGKCTSKGVSSENWFYTDYEKRKNYFPGGTVAEWKTDNRLLQISIKGKECPNYGNERGEYKYTIYVRFFDRSKDKEIEKYIKERESIQNNRIKEQRQKSINAF